MIQLTRQFALFKQTILNDTRSGGIQLLRFTFALILGLIIYIAQSETSRWREIDGLVIFEGIFNANLFFTVFAGFFLFTTIIREEKDEETLGMILMTGISPFAYLFGKLGSRLLMFTLMIAVQIPIIYFCITLGGISMKTILLSYLFILIITFHLANIFLISSLVCSGLFNGFLISGGLILILGFLFNFALDAFGVIYNGTLPFEGTVIVYDYLIDGKLPATYQTITFTYFAYLIVTGLICFLLSVVFFNSLAADQENVTLPKKLRGKNSSEQKAESFSGHGLSKTLRILRSKRFGNNPLTYKDFRFTAFGPIVYFVQFILIVFILYNAIPRNYEYASQYILHRYSRNTLVPMYFIGSGLLIIISNIVFFSEIKGQTLHSLILLPQTCNKLYWQKIRACIKVCFPCILIIVLSIIGYLVSDSDFDPNLRPIILISSTMLGGLFINCLLSVSFKKFSFLLSSALTVGFYILQISLLELMDISKDTIVYIFLAESIILTPFIVRITIQKLKKIALTS